MEEWVKDRLSICLGFEIPNDMITYIMSIKNSEALDEYFASLLSTDVPDHRAFIFECKKRLFSDKQAGNKKQPTAQASKKQPNTNQDQQSSSTPSSSATAAPGGGGKKKKNKFVPLFTNDGKVPNTIMLKGRRECDCEASEHKLINNCMGCGRIVCEQEGSGPCLFCGELVCTNEEMEIIKSTSKKGEQLKQTLLEKGGNPEEKQKAIVERDRLIDFDRNAVRRTQVIDDEMDYFDENSVWLSEAEREKFESLQEEMHTLRHRSRLERKIRIDLFGREIEEDVLPEGYEEKVRQEISDTIAARTSNVPQKPIAFFTNPELDHLKYVYKPMEEQNLYEPKMPDLTDKMRVQDKELLEVQDMRVCLSMHQPYASLLVAGIKKHEGRCWYSSHRGRLWIASTAKVPTKSEVDEVEGFYKKLYNDDSLKFPSQYQNGCLLGCVKVEEVLSQEEYRESYPAGESDSPFVFICSNPVALPVVFPIKGSHKIYKMDPQIYKVASAALMRAGEYKDSQEPVQNE